MTKFTFRLDAPLRLARARRGELRRELAALMRNLAEAEDKIAAEGSRLQEIDAARMSRAAKGIPGDELARITETRDMASARVASLEIGAEAIRREEKRTRNDLAAIGRQVEVLERLRAEARAAHVKMLLDKDQAEVDDLTLRRFARREPETEERVPR